MAEIVSKYPKTEINKEFVKTYFELLNFMKAHVTSNNKDFKYFYNKNLILRKTNVKYFIKLYYERITKTHGSYIMDENIEYFLNNDFKEESTMVKSSTSIDIGKYITFMKGIYHSLDKKMVDQFVSYLKKLTFLSVCYFN
jgi:hypothetical protein